MSTTTTAHPAWCGGCEHNRGMTVHRGIGYSVTVAGERGEVVPLIVDGEPVVDVDVPTGHLTPAEARRLARALAIMAGAVEDAAGGEQP